MIAVRNQAGFTVVEIMSTLIVTALFVGLILYFGISYWRYSALLESNLSLFVSRLDAQDYIRESVGTSRGLITQNSIPDAHTMNPDISAGAQYWQILHAVPGTTTIGSSGTTTPVMYYRRISTNTANQVAMNGTQPYEDEYVLYLDGTTKQLRVRTLANPNVANNKAITSCPPSAVTAGCPADKVILENVLSVGTTYYSRSGSTLNYQSSYDTSTNTYTGPDFPTVEAVQFNLKVNDKPQLQKTNATSSETVVRIALRNT